MKHAFTISSLALAIALSACKKEATPAPDTTQNTTLSAIADGTYTGTFERQGSGSNGVAAVSLTFSNGTWTGQGQTPRYPGLCHGTYTVVDDSHIKFTNQCPWTADFDWTLILGQEYTFKVTGNQLVLTQELTTASRSLKNVYQLTR
ncbi:hypothetical protein [Hymenobacter pini]|uniref:hypothetical protein n=1 Tax=Hymenobacter pini TaxID=2880879 RepID=UPI001CF51FA7|nr:hypothetical protein [Hymenobacter pini]MCA8829858.1 hypothetical protein [Hymenobacter pini]